MGTTVAQEELVATAPSLPFAFPPKRQPAAADHSPMCLAIFGVRQVAIKPAGS